MERNENMIIVSMTSWPKRICNVKTVLESLINQEVMADYIELNLSEIEFPNHENDLPEDLINFINVNKSIEINWLPTNDKLFKKFIPTLKKFYGKKYYLLTVDDDWIYRSDYIKLMIQYLERNNSDVFSLSHGWVVGNRMIYKSSAFGPEFWERVDDLILSLKSDDWYIEHYMRYMNRKMDHFRPADVMNITKEFNPVSPNSGNDITGQYSKEDIKRDIEICKNIKF